MRTKFWPKNLKGKDNLEDLGVDERLKSEWILVTLGVKMWIGFIWIRTETSGGLLWTRQ